MSESKPPPTDWSARATLHGSDPDAPIPTDPATGMQVDYVVLSDDERARGFVRPVRQSYVHVGKAGPKHPTRPLTPSEDAMFNGTNNSEPFVVFEVYPEGSNSVGRFWTQRDLDVGKGCGVRTTMGRALAETYAREPTFYSATFCCGCKKHIPVGERGEFVWDGTDERVGS